METLSPLLAFVGENHRYSWISLTMSVMQSIDVSLEHTVEETVVLTVLLGSTTVMSL